MPVLFPLTDPWQSFVDPNTKKMFFYDPEFQVSTFDHPMVYEVMAWEKSHTAAFSGCNQRMP